MTKYEIDWWLVAILVVATGLFLFDLGERALWWDEIINIHIESQPISGIFASLSNTPGYFQDIHPPLYHLFMHYWIKLAGTSDLAMRLPSALLSILAVGIVYGIGVELGSKQLGRTAAFLTAIAPIGIMYLRMGRYYSLTFILGVLATWLFLKLLTASRLWLWLAYGITALAMYYTDYLVVSLLAAHTIIVIWQSWRSNRSFIFKFLALQVVVGLAYLPWVPFIFAQVGWASKVVLADLAFSPIGYFFKMAFPFISFTSGETLFPWEIPAIIGYLVFGILFVLGVIKRRLDKSYHYLLLLLFFVPFIGTISIISVVLPTIPFIGVPNRSLFALPYFNLVVGLGWLSLGKRWKQVVTLVIIVLVALWGNINYFQGKNFFNPIYAVPTEELVEFVINAGEPGDIVVSSRDIGVAYYLKVRNRDVPHYWPWGTEDAAQIIEQQAAPRIWWITYGRDRTRNDERVQALQRHLAANGYQLLMQKGWVPQDPIYRGVKEWLLNRESYDYKVKINLYVLEDS